MKTIQVHSFRMGDVEDVEIWAAQSLYEWEKSEKGQWVMTNAIEVPVWNQTVCSDYYGYLITVQAKFTDEDAVFYKLKWD